MKKLLSIVIICSIILCGCVPVGSESIKSDNNIPKNDISSSSASDEQHENSSLTESSESTNEDISEPEPLDLTNKSESDSNSPHFDVSVKGLDDEILLSYVEDNVYENLVKELDSDKYFVENVEAIYYPREYIEALASNSQSNIYFGYTASELNDRFKGTKYVFTLGEDGNTVVVPMETISDDVYVKAMENVIIGSGVILVCVTVSFVASPVAPAVSLIFAASATTGTTFALESGGLSFAAAAIAKGYETESFDQALKAGAQAGSEAFKWGAITGAVAGGAIETYALKGATLNGLTMNEAAKIQKESGFPLELIKQFKSYKEYEVYKNAGLYTKMVNGKLALVRNIDLNYVSELPNGEKVTNLVRMQKGYAPLDPATGKAYQLHHINQDPNGTLAILTEAEHQGNSSILNLFGKESEIDRKAFNKIREEFWKKYAASLI